MPALHVYPTQSYKMHIGSTQLWRKVRDKADYTKLILKVCVTENYYQYFRDHS